MHSNVNGKKFLLVSRLDTGCSQNAIFNWAKYNRVRWIKGYRLFFNTFTT